VLDLVPDLGRALELLALDRPQELVVEALDLPLRGDHLAVVGGQLADVAGRAVDAPEQRAQLRP
jgi:hypothetical protein